MTGAPAIARPRFVRLCRAYEPPGRVFPAAEALAA